MTRIIFILAMAVFFQVAAAQKPSDLDKSPMDVSYLPANYPLLKMKGQVNGEPYLRLLYSRPQKKGRTIFGEEVKFDEIWRLGANEATEAEIFRPLSIAGKKIPKGRYSVYCIPSKTRWTVIFNKDNYNWGSFAYKSDKDVARIEVPVQKSAEQIEALTMFFDNNNWTILWDDVKVQLPVSY